MALLTHDGRVIRYRPMTMAEAMRTRESIRTLRAVEREAIESALILCDGDRGEASRRLGIGRATIFRKIREFKDS